MGGGRGREGKIGSELHCTDFSTICTGSRLCLFWRDATTQQQQLKRRQSSDKKEEEEEEEEEGKKGGGGEECEKDKIMTEKEDRTVSGLAQSRDLFESQEEDNLKRSQYCVCNNILCDCDENPESKSLLDNC